MKFAKPVGQLIISAIIGFLVFEIGPATLFSFGPIVRDGGEWVTLCVGVLSLGTPKRFMWMTLAGWSFFFGYWSVYELGHLQSGDMKFGPMLWPYGIAALIFAVAAGVSASGKGKTFLIGRRNLNPS